MTVCETKFDPDAPGKAIFQVTEASTKNSSISLSIQKLWLTNNRDGGV